MKRSPVSPVNKAMVERLKSTLAVPVYDYVPAGKKPPYVVITDTAARDWSTKTSSGAVVTATLKGISEYQGDKEVAQIADMAIAALLRPLLEVGEGWQVVLASIADHTVERLETHREATIIFKFTMVDTREG